MKKILFTVLMGSIMLSIIAGLVFSSAYMSFFIIGIVVLLACIWKTENELSGG
jgi:hypothetical protein